MKWATIIALIMLSNTALAFEVFYTGKNSKVILTKAISSENELNKYGKRECSETQFCVLWFFYEQESAELGAKVMKSGDMFASTPGMYAIFSRNKVVNNVICYEPDSGC